MSTKKKTAEAVTVNDLERGNYYAMSRIGSVLLVEVTIEHGKPILSTFGSGRRDANLFSDWRFLPADIPSRKEFWG